MGTYVLTEKALFEAWERQTAEMAGLETAFSPTLTPGNVMTPTNGFN